MGDSAKFKEIIDRIVGETLDEHISALRQEIAERASRELEALAPAPAPAASAPPPVDSDGPTPSGGAPTDLLNAAFCTVLDSNSQAEILGNLLDGTAKFSRRSALFVIRGGSASGWRARGFQNCEAVKNMPVDLTSGLAARAYQDRQSVQAAAAEFDPQFISTFGEPLVGTNAIVLPLVLRDKVAAIVYADGGADGKMDPSALECLVRSAGLWLEIVSMRKAGTPVAEAEEPRTGTQKMAAAAEPVHHEPPPPAPVAAVAPEPDPVPAPPPTPAPAPAAAAAAAPASGMSFEDEEVHKKAKRFAKLLVDELKLYNQQKVTEGRAKKDLYSRLHDDIEKSRQSYEKRYGQTVAGPSNYFTTELVRILCDGDPSVLGSGYKQ